MKRLLVLIFLPLLLFGFEKVNLIKDHSFENNNSNVWKTHAKTMSGKDLDPKAVSIHDSAKACTGSFSGYCDTRIPPSPYEVDSAVIMQGFEFPKNLSDLDSLVVNYSFLPILNDFNRFHTISIVLRVSDSNNATYKYALYYLGLSNLPSPTPLPPKKKLEYVNISEDTLWHKFPRDIVYDLTEAGFSNETKIESLALISWGANVPPWYAQKGSFDDIRLTGYADYDVGVKAILSKDSIGNAYTPTARIKNFGRKPADSFLVIATIEGGSGVVYADTLSWSLTADTEDTVSFKEFKPSDALDYTLTVSTLMTPDESDEDDVMSKTLYGTGVEEQPIPQAFDLDVASLQGGEGVLRVFYSLPLGEQGIISLYDPSGRKVESLKITGSGSVSLKSNLPSGVYFIKLEAKNITITRKAVILH